jgi:hypothetical protein
MILDGGRGRMPRPHLLLPQPSVAAELCAMKAQFNLLQGFLGEVRA